ncbi:DUF7507 domain-containing protein [Leifsonia xyli]|uniref:DUF7507 domain-containing protein n=1 Tax=Leifsonia xyli TaxID=1575 RepID=UPI003D6701D1
MTSPPDDLTIPTTPAPALALTKSSATTTVTHVGQVVPYAITVSNTGNVTIAGIQVTDSMQAPATDSGLSALACPQTTLAVGEQMTCTVSYAASQADLDAGAIANTATASGTAPDGSTVRPPDAFLIVPADQQATLALKKTGQLTGNGPLVAGEKVTYSFVVTNTGNVTVDAIAIDEAAFSGSGPLPAPICPPGALPPGAQAVCTTEYTVTQGDVDAGTVANAAIANGTAPNGPVSSPPSDAVVPLAAHPGLTLHKSVDPVTVASAGDTVTYRFEVSNTGNVSVSALAIDETAFSGTGTMTTPVCGVTVLAPGQSTTCTAHYSVTQADVDAGHVTNTAVANATSAGARRSHPTPPPLS